MADHRESVVLAAVTVALIAIPAASQNIEIKGTAEEIGLINSEFSDKFKVDFSTGKQVTTYLDKQSKLKTNKTFDKNTKKLETAKGDIKVIKTSQIINKTVKTPYGNFNFGVKNGENFSNYEGENKQKAKEIKKYLIKKLDEKSAQAKEKRELIVEKMLPSIKLSVEDKQSIEHFNLTNKGNKKVDMSAWTAFTEGSDEDTLELEQEIKPGETITYYSGSNSNSNIGENIVETDVTIYSGGKITIYNHVEKVVAKSDY